MTTSTQHTRFISISGNIGCGKSSLLKRLQNNFDVCVEPEPVHEWGEWLQMFYLNPKQYAMGLQLKILMSFKDLFNKHRELNTSQPVLVERSPIEGLRVFANALVDADTGEPVFTSMELDLLQQLVSYIGWVPHTYIYLRTTPSVCVARIQSRNIHVEQNISHDYINKLHDKYELLFSPFLARTETLGSKQVFVVDADDTQDAVFQKVSALLQKSGLINCDRI